MRKKKPTIAGLQRELEELKLNFDEVRREVSTLGRDLLASEQNLEETQRELKRSDKQVAWHERQQEDLLRYYDEALQLFRPHLVPSYTDHSIETPTTSLDRFIVQVRERITRRYDAMGHNLYASQSNHRY